MIYTSKFNKIPDIAKDLYERPDATLNYEGALAFKLDPLTELYLKAASTLVGEPKYYTDNNQSDIDLLKSINEVAKIDPEFILQLAVYCREKLYLRSVPLVLLAEFANSPDCVGKATGEARIPGARKYVPRIIQRADELTELMAYQLARNKIVPRPSKYLNTGKEETRNKRVDKQSVLPQMIKFGLAKAFKNFDAYQIAKYNRDGSVKMRDVMFEVHPEYEDENQKKVLDKLANKTLEPPETWEVMRSTGKMTWHDVINHIFYKEGRINNYMAQLRNLRNCLQDNSVTTEDIMLLCKMITDKKAVLRNKQLPFRYLSAYKELCNAVDKDVAEDFTPVGALHISDVLEAIEIAASYSIDNIPKLSGSYTLIATDFSGSMKAAISKKSNIERFEIGAILSTMAHRFCGHAITGIFADEWKVVPMAKSSGILRNTLDMVDKIGSIGYSTNGYKVIEYLLDNDIKVDRIMVFTDCQMWDSDNRMYWGRNILPGGRDISFAERFLRYQRLYPEVKLYTFDLSGYGNVMIPQNTKNVCLVGGWSDRIFDFVQAFEELGDGKVVINKIKSINVTS